MYSDEQSRINAVISYFFLGPLFLLAKKGTPLANPYVRNHAKRSSMIIVLIGIAYIIATILRPWTNFLIPGLGIQLSVIIVGGIIGIGIFLLISGAYKAYHGGVAEEKNLLTFDIGNTENQVITQEEERIRILASMIPGLGILIAKKYPSPEIIRGRIIGSGLFFLYCVVLWITGGESLLTFGVVVGSILIFVIRAVYLFVYEKLLSWQFLDILPSYDDIHSFVIAIFGSVYEFFRVAIGGNGHRRFRELYEEEQKSAYDTLPDGSYFMPINLLAVPFFNLFGIPSLFIEKYKHSRKLVLEGLGITLIWAYVFFFLRVSIHPLLMISLFPLLHILIHGKGALTLRTPIFSITGRLFMRANILKQGIAQVAQSQQSETFHYDEKTTL